MIEFQKKFPNAVFLFLDYNLYKVNNYAFQCFRIHKSLMSSVDLIDIEEDEQDIFKKFSVSNHLIQNLNFSLSEDVHSIFTNLLDEKETDKDLYPHEYFKSYPEKNNIHVRINELSKTTEKLIEEQQKYIGYYKTRKAANFGKNNEAEFIEYLNKRGNDLAKMDKIDISILSKNILNLNERIKSVTENLNVKNAFNLEIENKQ